MEQDELRENLTEGSIWIRGLFMLLFAILYNIAEIVIAAVAVLQFLIRLVTGSVNDNLLDLGYSASTYASQIFQFLTFNSEERPFPFSPWPSRDADTSKADSSDKHDDDDSHLGV
ncbi:MAG: DUF4389 domain-containing protein [Gammaproteobacteria bacterium]|nr:DUF4389 domain-containing protein [Gammaproteobacteria bacterium]